MQCLQPGCNIAAILTGGLVAGAVHRYQEGPAGRIELGQGGENGITLEMFNIGVIKAADRQSIGIISCNPRGG
jgi:hypothetical protein